MSWAEDFLFSRLGDDMDDEYIAHMYEKQNKYSFQLNQGYWVTKSGDRIYPDKMSKNHIVNTIRLIERCCQRDNLKPSDYRIYNLLKEELAVR